MCSVQPVQPGGRGRKVDMGASDNVSLVTGSRTKATQRLGRNTARDRACDGVMYKKKHTDQAQDLGSTRQPAEANINGQVHSLVYSHCCCG